MKPRVLHLIPTLGAGGAERQLSLLAPAMQEAGARIAIGFHTGGPNLERLRDTGVDLLPLPTRSHHDPRVIADLYRLTDLWRPELVQTWLLQMDVMGGLAARWAGIPQVLSERSSAGLYTKGWKMGLRSRLGRGVRAIVANSQGGLHYWQTQQTTASLHLIRNGLSPADIGPPANDLGLGDCRLLVAAGRLSHEKNVPSLIAAFATALQHLTEHHAVLFGDGPEHTQAQALIAATPVAARLHLGGFTNCLGYWFGRADAFLSASNLEGHPNVVIEAAAAGCPMVLSDIPAHREVVDDKGAFFAPANAPSLLAEALVTAVTDRDDALRRAAYARTVTDELRIDRAAARYVELYHRLLAP